MKERDRREVVLATGEGKPLKAEAQGRYSHEIRREGLQGGMKRHEVEKACRRSTAGCGKPGVGRCLFPQAS
jgi:hypothetical protein